MKILKADECMNIENDFLSQDEINALLSGGFPSKETSQEKKAVKSSYKGLSTVEVMERLVRDLEHEENVFDEKEEFEQYFAFMIGRSTATSMINDIITELTLVEVDDHVLFRYRGRSIKIDRAKYEKAHPNCADIDQYLLACSEDMGIDPLEIDIEKVASKYSDEEIANIVDNILDMKTRFFEADESSADECIDQEELVPCDTGTESNEMPSLTIDERISRAKKRFNS